MAEIKKFTYCIKDIPSCCVNPEITWIDQPGVIISCPPNSKCVTVSYLESADPAVQKCVWLFIKCNSCGTDTILQRQVCFCNNGIGCGPCQDCGPDGVCVNRCVGICNPVTNTCVECDDTHPCPGDKKCVAGGCQCPPDKPHDLGNNRCVACVSPSECEAKYGKCYKCVDGACVYKGDCGGGVCDPRTGNCEECVTKSDCASKGDNFCCSDGKKCVCCPGFVLNPLTGQCVPKPKCDGEHPCGDCEDCVNGTCVPRQCPDGQICAVVNGIPGCYEKCDCNNPASCSGVNKVCKNISGKCVCVDCGKCNTGCTSGCHCAGNNNCEKDLCNGPCTNGAGCGGGGGKGCGCLDAKTCVDCSKLSCGTGECARALGCECKTDGTCGAKPNPCVGNCTTKGECGPGCTCGAGGKCIPCSYLSCPNGDCSKAEGCRCASGGGCEADPDYKCADTLEIVQFDDSCDLEGQLTKERGCSCPVISTLLSSTVLASTPGQPKTSGTHTIKFISSLYLGNNINDPNWLLNAVNNPEVSSNETATGGSLRLDIITNFQSVSGVTPEPLVTSLNAPISGQGVVQMGSATIYQMNGFPISSGDPLEKRIVSSVSFSLRAEGWEFPNTCKYPNTQIGTFEVITNGGFGSVRIQNGVSNSDTRDPKFVWYKSANGQVFDNSTWIRTRYIPLASSGKYIDHLHDEVVNGIKLVESCFTYGLKSDCSCKPTASKYVVFCKPADFSAILDENSCGKTVDVVVGKTCHANKNKTYELLINGSVKWTGSLFTAGHTGRYTELTGITSVVLRMKCGDKIECVKTKTFTPPTPPDVTPDAECAENGAKVLFTFWKNKYNPTFISVGFKAKNGAPLIPVEDSSEKISFLGEPYLEGGTAGIYEFVVFFQCGATLPKEIKKNCCEFFAPKISGVPCKGARYWVNLRDTVSYRVGPGNAYPISKAVLATMDLNKPFTFTPAGQSPITIQPANNTSIRWDKEGCSGGIVNALPCGGFTYAPEEVPLPTPTGTIPPQSINPPTEPGETYQIQVNGGGFVPYVPGATFAAKVGTNVINLKKDLVTETRTLEIRSSADCDIQESDIVISQNGQKYEVSLPNSDCPCAPEIPVPVFIKKVTKTGDYFRVEFYTALEELPALAGYFEAGSGLDPLIQSGELHVVAPNFEHIVNVSNTNKVEGYVDIPCTAKLADPLTLFYTLERVKNNEGEYGSDKTALLRFCLGWPSSLGTSITGIQLVNLTNSQTIDGIYATSVCYTFGQVDLTGGADLRFVVSLSDSTSFNINALDVLFPTGDDTLFVYGDNEVVCADCIGHVGIGFKNLKLVTGCSYPGLEINSVLNVCDGDTELISDYPSISFSTDPAQKGKIKVSFFENGELIKRKYISGGADTAVLDGTLPANPDGLEYGNEYTVEAKCICSAETQLGCVKPVISSAVLSCISGDYYSDGSSAIKLTYSLTSVYPLKSYSLYTSNGVLLDSFTTNAVGAVSGRVVELTEAQAGLELNLIVFAQFDGNCKSVLKLVPRSETILTWTRDCTDSPYTYDLIFAGSPVLEIISGTGTVVGSQIQSIPNNTAIVFRGVVGGCTSKEYTVQEDCTIIPTPSISVSVTMQQVTPSVSKSVTKSRTVSRSKNSNVQIYSQTPSVSREESPSVTPSISISGSIPITPSITKSISITKSATPSISISQTSNITPSVSISITSPASPSITISRTPSTSAPCDGNCANYPGFEGQLCGGLGSYCCNGVSYDPLTQICCSGVVVSGGDENNCGGCGYVCDPGSTCVNGVCKQTLSLVSSSVIDGPCKVADASGFCISKASIATQIPNDATNLALVSYNLDYGGSIGIVDVTSGATLTTSPGQSGKTKVVAVAIFDAFKVPIAAGENNIVVISYKRGNTTYEGTFSGGGSVANDWSLGGSPICSGDCA